MSAPAVLEDRFIAARNAGMPDTARLTKKHRNNTAGQKKAGASTVKQKKEKGKEVNQQGLLKKP